MVDHQILRVWAKARMMLWLPLLLSATASTFTSFLPGPWSLPVWLTAAVAMLIWLSSRLLVTVLAAIRRQWRRCVLALALAVSGAPQAACGLMSGDYLHLLALYPYYLSQSHRDPDWRLKQTRFPWGDAAISVTDGIRLRILIYDPSGKIATGLGQDPDSGLQSDTRHLLGDFYLTEFSR